MVEDEQPRSRNGESTLAYRLRRMEEELRDLTRSLQSSVSTLGAGITAVSNQIGTFSANLPDAYTPRREADKRHEAIEDRFKDLDRRLDERKANQEQRFIALELQQRELEVRQTQKHTANENRIDRIERAAWAGAISVLMLLLGVVFAIFKATSGAGG